MFVRRLTLLALSLGLLLGGCGGGGIEELFTAGSSGGGPTPGPAGAPAFAITTSSLPPGYRDAVYPATQLQVVGATAPTAWVITAGALPAGLQMSAGGTITGQPQVEGVFAFSVEATDGTSGDARSLTLAVEAFGVTVQGLRLGDAWGGETITLTPAGNVSTVTFEVVANQSGGSLDVDPVTSQGRWVPGAVTTPCQDRIHAVDPASGRSREVALRVMPHPAPHHVAEFGTSDVWYVDFDVRVGTHLFRRDFDHALHLVGLRSVRSTGLVGEEADELASFYVRRQVLRNLNAFYLRQPDGRAATGLGISFPLERPDGAYSAPDAGRWVAGGPGRYGVIGVGDGSEEGVLGLAYLDASTNAAIENDSTSTTMGELGVFVNQIVTSFNVAFMNRTLPDDPVGPYDVADLRALVYGDPVGGARAEEIRRVADGFARTLAAILAHEIGHSVGLGHTPIRVTGSIMNTTAAIYPGAAYKFLDEDVAQLRTVLPGPGRSYVASKHGEPSDADVAPLGVVSCEHCRLRLAAPTARR